MSEVPATLVVTGGSRGIGAEVARAAARRGFDVAVGYRREHEAAEAVAETVRAEKRRALAIPVDVADEASVVAMFDTVITALGRPAALVNCAGLTTPPRACTDYKAAEIEALLRVNVAGTMLCCREAIRLMSRGGGGSGGVLVNVSSMAATSGGRLGHAHYAASKAAVDALTRGFSSRGRV